MFPTIKETINIGALELLFLLDGEDTGLEVVKPVATSNDTSQG